MRNVITWESWLCQLLSSLKYVTELANFSQKYHRYRRIFFLFIAGLFFCTFFFFFVPEEVYKICCFTPLVLDLVMVPVFCRFPILVIYPKVINPLSLTSDMNKLASDLLRHKALFSQGGQY